MKLYYIGGLVLFIAIIAILAVYFYNNKREKFSNSDNIKVQIVLFKAEWCGYCKKYIQSNVFDDAYAKAKDQYPGVVFVTRDYDSDKELAGKYNINSFPTIIAVDGDGNYLTKFNGDRNNTDELIKFVNDNMRA